MGELFTPSRSPRCSQGNCQQTAARPQGRRGGQPRPDARRPGSRPAQATHSAKAARARARTGRRDTAAAGPHLHGLAQLQVEAHHAHAVQPGREAVPAQQAAAIVLLIVQRRGCRRRRPLSRRLALLGRRPRLLQRPAGAGPRALRAPQSHPPAPGCSRRLHRGASRRARSVLRRRSHRSCSRGGRAPPGRDRNPRDPGSPAPRGPAPAPSGRGDVTPALALS